MDRNTGFVQQALREVVCSRIPVRHYCGLIFLPQVANAICADEPRSGVQMGQAPRHHSTHQRGADEGRYNALAVLPQGAFDVQSIRTSQTTDPWAKQTRPVWPCTKFG